MTINTRLYWTLFFLFFSLQAGATLSVRIYIPDETDAEISVRMNSLGSQYNLFTEQPKGSDGTIDSNPAKVYIPGLGGVVSRPEASLYSLNGSNRGANLPTFSLNNFPTANLVFEKEVTITTNEPAEHFLHAAVGNNISGNDWRVIGINSSAISNGVSRLRRNISVQLNEFCNRSTAFNCNDLVNANNSLIGQVYFFLSPTILGLGAQINPKSANYSHGVYYAFNVSTRVYDQDIADTPTELDVDLFRVIKGDESVSVQYRVNAVMNDVDRTIVLYFGETLPFTDAREFIGNYTGADRIVKVFDNEYTSALNGRLLVSPLPNEKQAVLAVAQVDKYNFVSRLSDFDIEKPEAIATLLREQSCFFFTAGFQRKHPVTERLQKFRSEVLMSFEWGRRFVRFYYLIGPQYAPYVLESRPLQIFIQGLGHTLVFLIDYGVYLVFSLGLGMIFFVRQHRKRKSLLA